MGYKLDKIQFCTAFEAYKNYATTTEALNIPADTLPNGATNNYFIATGFDRGGTRADIYLDGNGVKILANTSSRLETGDPYQFVGLETASCLVQYASDAVVVIISLSNNTGGPITLTAQTINVSLVQYDAPITAL